MLLRMSSLFLRTLREDPADAEVPSHRLLVRAGYVRRVAPGIFTWLPLGYHVYRNVERDRARGDGRAPASRRCTSRRCCRASPTRRRAAGREYGANLFRLQDRKGTDYLLGPTHEEMFTLLVKGEYSSYKDLPLALYQIQTKYRDEARPRAGILRGREFVMKDSYSFDVDDAGLQASYDEHRDAYISDLRPARPRLRHRLGDVRRDGRLGVRGVPRAERDRRGHLRPLQRAATTRPTSRPSPRPRRRRSTYADAPAAHVEDTPDTPTIDTLVDARRTPHRAARADRAWTAADTLKNVVLTVTAARRHDRTRSSSACPATARST